MEGLAIFSALNLKFWELSISIERTCTILFFFIDMTISDNKCSHFDIEQVGNTSGITPDLV